ncbi:MAG TPA: hypothetical protein V6C65_26645 [Allocoleopsis sp.]
MNIKDVAELAEINPSRVEAILKEMKISKADISEQEAEIVIAIADHMAGTGASIEESVWTVFGQHQHHQAPPQQPSQNTQQPQSDELAIALKKLEEDQQKSLENFKSSTQDAAIAAMRAGQQVGADMAAAATASTLRAFVEHTAAYNHQIEQYMDQFAQGSRNTIASGMQKSFNLAEGKASASLPPMKLRQIAAGF